MKIVVCVKHVPDAEGDRAFNADHTTDRENVDGLLSELDEYAIEAALQLQESAEAEVVALTVGPDDAAEAVKKALQMGADSGVHVEDEAIHGSDALATSAVLAAAIQKIGEVDLVLTGLASTDGGMSVIPAMLAERLQLPQITQLATFEYADGKVKGRRDYDDGSEELEAPTPAVVSVNDQCNEPRYPSLKGIMAAKRKSVESWGLDDLSLDGGSVGLSASKTTVTGTTKRPPREQGEIVTDGEVEGGKALVEFLRSRKLV